MSVNRLDLVRNSFEKKALPSGTINGKVSEIFGDLVFDRAKMRKYLDPQTLTALRKPVDRLEELVDNRIWPLPKYRELLFIS